MRIIGIGGLSRSGKDTLAQWLIDKGYYGVSLGDIIRNESRKRHAYEPDPISVANMTETANWLRRTKGPDFALKEAINQLDKVKNRQNYKGLVLFSIRAPIEVDFIRQRGGKIIWVEATDEVRYQRAKQNRRPGEVEISLVGFISPREFTMAAAARSSGEGSNECQIRQSQRRHFFAKQWQLRKLSNSRYQSLGALDWGLVINTSYLT